MNSLFVSNSTKSLQRFAPIATKALMTSPLISQTAIKCIPIIAEKLHTYNRFLNTRSFDYDTLQHHNTPEKERLSDITNGKFIKVINDLELWLKNEDNGSTLEIYDESRIDSGLAEGKNTYLGGNCCQMASHLLARELVRDNYDVKLFLNEFRNYPCNHFYLTVTGNGLEEPLIVDPSYRQFFRIDNTSDLKEYNKFLFEKSAPFFVGTREDIKEFVKTLLSKKAPEPFEPNPKLVESHPKVVESNPKVVEPDVGTKFWDPKDEPNDFHIETIYWNSDNAIDVTFQLKKLEPIMEKYTSVKSQG